MSQFFASGGQNFGASVSALFLPTNIQDWFPLGLTGSISFQPKGLSRVLHIWGCWYFSGKTWFQLVLHPVQHCMMYCAYKLNKWGGNTQLCHTPFSILNQLVFPCPVQTVASWPAFRVLRRQVRWSGIPISLIIFQFVVIHTVKGFSVVNEVEVDIFLEFSCFLYDPVNVGNLISLSSAFSKFSLYIWISWFTYCWSLAWRIFSIILLPCEMSEIVWEVELSLALSLFGIEMKADLF